MRVWGPAEWDSGDVALQYVVWHNVPCAGHCYYSSSPHCPMFVLSSPGVRTHPSPPHNTTDAPLINILHCSYLSEKLRKNQHILQIRSHIFAEIILKYEIYLWSHKLREWFEILELKIWEEEWERGIGMKYFPIMIVIFTDWVWCVTVCGMIPRTETETIFISKYANCVLANKCVPLLTQLFIQSLLALRIISTTTSWTSVMTKPPTEPRTEVVPPGCWEDLWSVLVILSFENDWWCWTTTTALSATQWSWDTVGTLF